MAPIHDTDVASERWSKAEWENYELWEKVEVRLRKRKRLWITSTVILVLILSALPIFADRWPKWVARSVVRQIALEFNRVKKEASLNHGAYRIRIMKEAGLSYRIEKVNSCHASTVLQIVRQGDFSLISSSVQLTSLDSQQGLSLGIPGIVQEFCYDAVLGADTDAYVGGVAGLAVIPVKDLTEKRIDRVSVLILSGGSAEISFD